MSKDPKVLHLRSIASAFDDKVRRSRETTEFFVQASRKYVPYHSVERLIICAYAKILEKIPYDNGQSQYKIEIPNAYIDALYEGWPAIEISKERFRKPPSEKPFFAKGPVPEK